MFESTRTIIDFLKRSEYSAEELDTFEYALRTQARFHEPQIEIGLLGELPRGRTDIISRDKALYQRSLNVLLELKKALGIIIHLQEAISLRRMKLEEFHGVDIEQVSGYPILYDLDNLRESSEFIYATQSMGSGVMGTSVRFGYMAETLESFLTVLEEYE